MIGLSLVDMAILAAVPIQPHHQWHPPPPPPLPPLSLLKSPLLLTTTTTKLSSSSSSGPPLETSSDVDPSFRGCKTCGKEEVEKGCNGEGRIQGGIATVPGFGWWPIKAFRPCPGFVASGGRYRRRGQSMDDVASGRARSPKNTASAEQTTDESKSSGEVKAG